MKRVLVTGGAGFIGSHIVAALLRGGHEVVVLDDLSTGRMTNVEDVLQEAPDPDRVPWRLVFLRGSVLDEETLGHALEGVDVVFHQAAVPSVPRSFADPAGTLSVNVEGTGRLLDACRKAGVRRVVFASSSSVYGDSPTLPKHEEMPTDPRSPYALSKLSGEGLCAIYSREYGLACRALRYFNVFGPRQDPASEYAAVIPNFVSRMLEGKPPVVYGDGGQSRDFTYVDNVVAANLLAAGLTPGDDGRAGADRDDDDGDAGGGATPAGSRVFNVGTGSRHTLLDLVEVINGVLGTDLAPEFDDPRPGDVRHSHASIERARQIGYRPAVDFTEGIRRTVAWFDDGERVGRADPDVSTANREGHDLVKPAAGR